MTKHQHQITPLSSLQYRRLKTSIVCMHNFHCTVHCLQVDAQASLLELMHVHHTTIFPLLDLHPNHLMATPALCEGQLQVPEAWS